MNHFSVKLVQLRSSFVGTKNINWFFQIFIFIISKVSLTMDLKASPDMDIVQEDAKTISQIFLKHNLFEIF